MSTQTLKAYYCSFCETVNRMVLNGFKRSIEICESIGTAQAAHRLASMGYYEEAKQLILAQGKKNEQN